MTDTRWFNKVRKEFRPLLLPFAGEPITYVEIGVWEGTSAHWVCSNILTHPDSRGYGIDPYPEMRRRRHPQSQMDERYERTKEYLAVFPNFMLIRETSRDALTDWGTPIDVLYVDGRHECMEVCLDFVQAWPWLKVGSLVIFDDYGIGNRKEKKIPCVPQAIEALSLMFDGMIKPASVPNKQAAFTVVRKEFDKSWKLEQIEKRKK